MRYVIHIVANSLDPKRGGLEQSALRIARHLKAHPDGAEVFLYSREEEVENAPDLSPGPMEYLGTGRRRLLEPFGGGWTQHYWFRLDVALLQMIIRRRIKTLPEQQHVILSFYASSAGFVAQHVANLVGIPHIASVRGTDFSNDMYSREWMHCLEFTVKSATWVVTTNLTQEAQIRDVFGRKDCIRTIYNSCEKPSVRALRLRKRGKAIRLFCDTGFSFKKATHLVMRAVETLAGEGLPVHLTAVGSTEMECADFFDGERKSLLDRFPKNFDFRGQVSQTEARRLLLEADAYCSASLSEGCSNATLKALVHGLPIVSTNVGILPDLAGGLDHVLVSDPVDFEQFVANLRTMVTRLLSKGVSVSRDQISLFANRLSPAVEASAWHRVIDDTCGSALGYQTSGQRRVLFFVHDGTGLGHLRRISRIARILQGPCACMIVSGHRHGAWLIPPECGYMLLPSLDTLLAQEARYWDREPFLKVKRSEALGIRRSLLESVFNCFKPDAVFVDYLPLGKNEELGRLIGEGKFRKYFVMRGMLDHPDKVRSDVMQGRAELALATRYDKIFVACDPKICNVEREYQLHDSIAKKLAYVGYVSEAVSEEAIETARNERGIPAGGKWIVCSAGGGKLGENLIKECIHISKRLSECFFDIIVGPRSSLRWDYRTSEVFGFGRVRIHRECLHLPMLHAACDVAVISGGYNSLVEVMEGRASIVIVPTQVLANDEQYLHASRLARHVPIHLVQGIQDVYEAVKTAVTGPMRRKSSARSSISLDGAEAIRKILFQDLNIRG